MWSIDLFATALDAAGLPIPKDKPLDGKSILPALKNETDKLHDELFWSSAGIKGKWAIRSGNWKLVAEKNQIELFDLEKDPEELIDLASDPACADVLKELEAALRDICDPEAMNALAFADQAALIEHYGGREAALKLGAPGATPPPKAGA